MKKSILLGCVAACTFWTTMAFSAPADSVIRPTADELKTAFTSFLKTKTKVGSLFNLNQMTVQPDGENFNVTLPAVQNDKFQVPARTLHLTYAGDFNNQAQYRIESVFESIQTLLKDLLPTATFTTESANVDTVWVPAYNMITTNSQNIKGLELSIPNMFNLSVGRLVADGLVRPISDKKMDASYSSDVQNIKIAAENAVIEIPSVSTEVMTTSADITGDPLLRMLSSQSDSIRFTVPGIQLKMQGAADSMASATVSGLGVFKDGKLHYETKVNQISSPALGAFIPAVLVPTEVTVSFDLLGMDKDALSVLVQAGQKGKLTDEAVPALKQAVKTGSIHINLLGAKNNLAGVAFVGDVRTYLKNEDKVTTLNDFGKNLEPIVNAKLIITNLDKISPEPTVNQVRCDRAKAHLAGLDPNAADAATQKQVAERIQARACAPQGGPFDAIRPYLNANNRVTAPDGTTTDTITIQYDNNVLTLNGQQVSRRGSVR